MRKDGLSCFGNIEQKCDADQIKCCMMVEVDGTKQRGLMRKTCLVRLCYGGGVEFGPVLR